MEDEYFTFSHMSKQDSESDIYVDDTQNPENPHTPKTLQIHTPSGPKYLQHFFCAAHIGHVGFVPGLGWRFWSIIL